MRMKNAALVLLSISVLKFLSCSSSSDGMAGVDQSFVVNSQNDNLTVVAALPSIDSQISIGRDFTGTAPTVPPSEVSTGSSDNDGDGILDGQDHIPNVCTKMVVSSFGVSSGRIIVNDDELYSPDDFQNKDFSKTSVVNLKEGDNHLSIRIDGASGDQLNVRFYDCTENPSDLVFDMTLTKIKI